MGTMKEEMMNSQEEERDRELAKLLGISYDELSQLDHWLDEETNNDSLVVSLLVHFSDHSPKHILAKIRPLLDESDLRKLYCYFYSCI